MDIQVDTTRYHLIEVDRNARAEAALQRILAENEANQYRGIDRSPNAVKKRRYASAWCDGNEGLENIAPPAPGTLPARLNELSIQGKISYEQELTILQIRAGLRDD